MSCCLALFPNPRCGEALQERMLDDPFSERELVTAGGSYKEGATSACGPCKGMTHTGQGGLGNSSASSLSPLPPVENVCPPLSALQKAAEGNPWEPSTAQA